MHYAIINDGVVVNVALADSPIDSNWIATETAGIGWAYDGTTFTAPVVVAAPAVATPISKREFLKRFTPAEYAAIKTAAVANAVLDWYWQQFLLADFLTMTDPDTVSGIDMLEAAGLIATGRAAQILA